MQADAGAGEGDSSGGGGGGSDNSAGVAVAVFFSVAAAVGVTLAAIYFYVKHKRGLEQQQDGRAARHPVPAHFANPTFVGIPDFANADVADEDLHDDVARAAVDAAYVEPVPLATENLFGKKQNKKTTKAKRGKKTATTGAAARTGSGSGLESESGAVGGGAEVYDDLDPASVGQFGVATDDAHAVGPPTAPRRLSAATSAPRRLSAATAAPRRSPAATAAPLLSSASTSGYAQVSDAEIARATRVLASQQPRGAATAAPLHSPAATSRYAQVSDAEIARATRVVLASQQPQPRGARARASADAADELPQYDVLQQPAATWQPGGDANAYVLLRANRNACVAPRNQWQPVATSRPGAHAPVAVMAEPHGAWRA